MVVEELQSTFLRERCIFDLGLLKNAKEMYTIPFYCFQAEHWRDVIPLLKAKRELENFLGLEKNIFDVTSTVKTKAGHQLSLEMGFSQAKPICVD